MNELHRKIIKQKIHTVAEITGSRPVLLNLLEGDGILESYEVQHIKSKVTDYEANTELYITLQRKGSNAFASLLSALEKSGNQAVVQELLMPVEPEIQKKRNPLAANHLYLVQHLGDLNSLLAHLLQEEVVTHDETDRINLPFHTSSQKNTELLKILNSKEWSMIGEKVIQALQSTGNRHCAAKLQAS